MIPGALEALFIESVTHFLSFLAGQTIDNAAFRGMLFQKSFQGGNFIAGRLNFEIKILPVKAGYSNFGIFQLQQADHIGFHRTGCSGRKGSHDRPLF